MSAFNKREIDTMLDMVTDDVQWLERVTWQSQSGSRSPASLCVYEFRDGLIARVYYYPVEK